MPISILDKRKPSPQDRTAKPAADKPELTATPAAAEPVDAKPTFYPRRKAARARQACIRCGHPVPAGALIERIPNPTAKGHIWVHAHCPGSEGAAAPAVVDNSAEVAALRDAINALQTQVMELKASKPRVIEVKHYDGKTIKIEGCVNKIFERVKQLAERRKNIFIPGPTGCGKTHLAEQVATALGLKFSFISCSAGMSEGQVTGRLLPVGSGGKFTYVPAEFVERYEKGGVFLFDEIDAADSNMLLVVNSALANGQLSIPNRPGKPVAKRHKDFVCIAAANTWGKGADREYCGRNQLDDATLDRFRIGSVPMDYDPHVEVQLCPHDELRLRLWGYRDRIMAARLKRPMSTRFMIDAYDMVQNAGWTLEMVDEAFFSGWSQDEIIKVKGQG